MLERPPRPSPQNGDAAKRLVVTSFFPHAAEPERGVFVLNLVRALRNRCAVSGVMSPWPWAPLVGRLPRFRSRRLRLTDDVVDGFKVERPRFLAWPGADVLNGVSFGIAVERRLLRDGWPTGLAFHGHCLYPDGVGVALAARKLGVPFLLTAHGSDVNVYARRAALRPQIRWALRAAQGVVAVSGPLKEAVEALRGESGPPVEHIPCAGFDPAVFRPRGKADARVECGLPSEGKLALFVGHLVKVKGVDILLEAWARLLARSTPGEALRLVVLGGGSDEKALRRQALSLGISEHVSFMGPMPHERIAAFLSAADVLCLSSRSEGTPNVVVEALAAGRPVVASRVGGIPELVKDGDNGLLANPRDEGAFALALETALGRTWPVEEISRSVSHLTWGELASREDRFASSCLLGRRIA